MAKRSAPSSPVEQAAPKKLKLNHDSGDTTTTPLTPPPETIEPPDPKEFITAQELADVDIVMMENAASEEVAKPQIKGKGKAKAKPKKTVAKKTGTKKASRTKQPPVQDGFLPWAPVITCPDPSPFWGIKPKTGDPLPHPDQPSARESNGATVPPLWEDLGFRFQRGSRHVRFFGPITPEGVGDLPESLDQESLLAIKLIDMRPVSKHDQSPRRTPVHYAYEHGKPASWSCKQTIKALNDRRSQAIARITLDAPWSPLEREYLAKLCEENNDASIWELTCLFNDHFMGQEHAASTAFDFIELSSGRTTESVRHQYVTYKPSYDIGEAPEGVRYRNDDSLAGKALRASKKMMKAFGPPSKALEKEFDEASGAAADDEGGNASSGDDKPAPKKKTIKKTIKKSAAPMIESDDEDEPVAASEDQPKLSDDDEQLLEMGGFYDVDYGDSDATNDEHDAEPMTETTAAAGPVNKVAPHVETLSEEDDKVIEQVVSGSLDGAVVDALQVTEQIKQISESHASSATISDGESILETAEIQVQVQAIATQKPAPLPVPVAPLQAARHIYFDEDYDCEDEEEL